MKKFKKGHSPNLSRNEGPGALAIVYDPELSAAEREVSLWESSLAQPGFTRNVDNLFDLRQHSRSLSIKWKNEHGAKFGESGPGGAWDVLIARALDVNTTASVFIDSWRSGKTDLQFMYGDPVSGDCGPHTQQDVDILTAEFAALGKILDDKKAVQDALFELSTAIQNDVPARSEASFEQRCALAYNSLLKHLGAAEIEAGFSSREAIPTGLLSPDEFFSTLAQGYVLNDFGAGVVHGELSHRLQWYAICKITAADNRFEPVGGLQHTAQQLYQMMNTAPFCRIRENTGRKNQWSILGDRAVGSDEKSYGYPGTLNRDLLASGFASFKRFKKVVTKHMGEGDANLAWPSQPNNLLANKALRYIGMALRHSLLHRFKQAEELGEQYTWTGLPPTRLVKRFADDAMARGLKQEGGLLWSHQED